MSPLLARWSYDVRENHVLVSGGCSVMVSMPCSLVLPAYLQWLIPSAEEA
jgi:hypothetical protein